MRAFSELVPQLSQVVMKENGRMGQQGELRLFILVSIVTFKSDDLRNPVLENVQING